MIYHAYFPVVTTAYKPTPPPSKRGLAGVVWTDDNHETTSRMVARCGWFHNWNVEGAVLGLEFVPFLWGWSWGRIDNMIGLAVDVLGRNYSGNLLWVNEPNDGNQANMTPAEAVRFYQLTRESLPHARLIGPNMSFYNEQKWMGDASWMRLFVQELHAQGVTADFAGMAIHNYEQEPNEHIRLHHAWVSLLSQLGFGHLPLWVTEWGIDHRHPEARQWTAELCQFYDGTPSVYRHAWYIHHAWAGDTFPIQSYLHSGNVITASGEGWLG